MSHLVQHDSRHEADDGADEVWDGSIKHNVQHYTVLGRPRERWFRNNLDVNQAIGKASAGATSPADSAAFAACAS